MADQPEKIFVKDLAQHNHIDTSFFCKQKEIRKKKNGDDYLMMILSDRTGDVAAFMWENTSEVVELFSTQDHVRVQGQIRYYNGRIQLNLHKVDKLSDNLMRLEDYFPTSTVDPEVMYKRFSQALERIEEPKLRELLERIFADPDLQQKFKRVPAGKSRHHACIGGLLEHTLSVYSLCELAADHYGGLNKDLLRAGAILHDIGKTEELGIGKGFEYTDEGRLLGHIVIGAQLVRKHIDEIDDFPEELRLMVLHMILSHHNLLEYGSPRRPKTPEAIILSFVDDMDAKFDAMKRLIKAEEHLENNWTSYSTFFERYLYKGAGVGDLKNERNRDP